MPDIKETLIDLLTGYSLDTYEDVQYVADELIAKGVLPVVRCKDCRWSHLDGWFCGGAGMMPEHTTLPESFCDHGKRKEAEVDG